jgi:hypothetical protein
MMAGACALLGIHAFLLSVTFDYWMLFASYAVFGVAMTAVNLAWNLGPGHFAPTDRDTESYMAVHVTLTGVRAVVGPVIALSAKSLLGLRAGFAVACGFYLLASALMLRLSRRVEAEGPGAAG